MIQPHSPWCRYNPAFEVSPCDCSPKRWDQTLRSPAVSTPPRQQLHPSIHTPPSSRRTPSQLWASPQWGRSCAVGTCIPGYHVRQDSTSKKRHAAIMRACEAAGAVNVLCSPLCLVSVRTWQNIMQCSDSQMLAKEVVSVPAPLSQTRHSLSAVCQLQICTQIRHLSAEQRACDQVSDGHRAALYLLLGSSTSLPCQQRNIQQPAPAAQLVRSNNSRCCSKWAPCMPATKVLQAPSTHLSLAVMQAASAA